MRSVFSLLAALAFVAGCASSGTLTEITPEEANLLGRISELEDALEARDRERTRRERELAERNREVADLNQRLSRMAREQNASAKRCETSLPTASPSQRNTGLYVVQIGAFRRPPRDFGDRAAKLGTLITTKTPSGFTRIQVGSYTSAREARQAQVRLRAAGYADAFVRRADPSTATLPEHPAPSAGAPLTSTGAPGLAFGPG